MANDVLPFFVYKEDVAAMADLRFLGCGCVNINWGLELLEHTRYAAYNSVGIPHPLDALATTPKALETTYENPCPLQTMHHPTFTSNISLMLLRINTPHGTTTSLCLISVHS